MYGNGYTVQSLDGPNREIVLIDDNGLYPKSLSLRNNLWDGDEAGILDVSVDGGVATVYVKDYSRNEYKHRFNLDTGSNVAEYIGTENL